MAITALDHLVDAHGGIQHFSQNEPAADAHGGIDRGHPEA
jgi:hypothetical protein